MKKLVVVIALAFVSSLFLTGCEKTNIEVPETCTVRFDGCNTCQVLDNGELACTRMYCEEKEEPKCLEYKEPETNTT
jgi:hypothetical protein